jgi:hypothetical protein
MIQGATKLYISTPESQLGGCQQVAVLLSTTKKNLSFAYSVRTALSMVKISSGFIA